MTSCIAGIICNLAKKQYHLVRCINFDTDFLMKTTEITDEEKREKQRQRQRKWRKNNPDKVKAQRERQRAKMKERKIELQAAGQWTTGYGRGRPKKGEERPLSKNAESAKKYRENNEKWREYNRTKQAEWSEKNPERRREIARAYYARKKERDGNDQ